MATALDQDDVIPVDLEYVFSIRIDFKERIRVPGPMQSNVYVPAAGGKIWGPRLQGKVVPYSGADYGGEFGLGAHYMLQADDGAYIYIHNMGYLYALNSDEGMARTSRSRKPSQVSARKTMPERKTTPRAVCQVTPSLRTRV